MADFKEKTYVEDVDRSVYDIRDEEHDAYRMESGLTPEIVEKLSQEKSDPAWMQQFRLESLQIYNEMKLPNWGPSIEGLDMDHIATYVRPNTKMRNDWKDVPEDIKETFERLGIPQAERKSLAGVGAQYDSELVYHNVKDSVAAEGVVYTDMESAQKGEYADMVRKYFMKLVTPHDHKFAALHGAVWSGGSFVYVPKGVHLSIPLQSYFRLNAKGAGQFEHTLIIVDEGASLHFIEGCSAPKYNVANLHAGCVELYVKKGAKLRYSTIENWSKNMYNLNTKRALVEEGGVIEWVSGSFGSHVGCLYPMSILKGDNSRMEFTGVTFAGAGQDLDTGAKVVQKHKLLYEYPLHQQERRRQHLPQQRRRRLRHLPGLRRYHAGHDRGEAEGRRPEAGRDVPEDDPGRSNRGGDRQSGGGVGPPGYRPHACPRQVRGAGLAHAEGSPVNQIKPNRGVCRNGKRPGFSQCMAAGLAFCPAFGVCCCQ